MTEIKEQLFEAFRADHAIMGKGFYELAERIRAKDESGARQVAERINQSVGAHIAFEENDFYPALAPFLSEAEIKEMYQDHAQSQTLIREVLDLKDGELDTSANKSQLLAKVEATETHISECGELFGALGGLTQEEQARLLQQLQKWRNQAPLWLDLATTADV